MGLGSFCITVFCEAPAWAGAETIRFTRADRGRYYSIVKDPARRTADFEKEPPPRKVSAYGTRGQARMPVLQEQLADNISDHLPRPAGSTPQRSERQSGFPIPGWVTQHCVALYPVSVRRIRDFVIGFLQVPPRGGHPCLDGWFRSSRPMGDFHPCPLTARRGANPSSRTGVRRP